MAAERASRAGQLSRVGRPRFTGTVRFRVTFLSTLVVAVMLVVTGFVLVNVQRRQLTSNIDEILEQRADELVPLVEDGTIEQGDVPAALGERGNEDTLFQVVAADGTVLASSPNIEGQPAIDAPPADDGDESVRTVDHLPIDEDSFRLLSVRVDTPDGPVVLYVASTYDDVVESTTALTRSLLVGIPVLLAVLAGLIWLLVGRTLRPIESIRTEVADIGARDLHRRVPEPSGDDEVARLARTMNAMLDRVETATQRQQRFAADASHELRSPLTRIRAELEVDLAHPEQADLADTHRSVLEDATRLQRLVDDLLLLARTDAGAISNHREPVDLDDLLLRDARRLRADGRVQVDISGVSGAQVEGDPDELARAVRNLTDNAVRHAESTVTLTLAEQDHRAVLTIADDGPGIPEDEHERVFERFARLDDARSADTGGTGLGLAITRDIVQRHGGTITIDTEHRPGTRFRVTLPAGAE